MVILTERGHLQLTIMARRNWDDFQAALWCLRHGA